MLTTPPKRKTPYLLTLVALVGLAATVLLFSPWTNRPKAFFYSLAGNFRAHEDDIDGAEELYEKALELNPESFRALTGIGVIHRKRGEYAEATACYERALAINPSHADAHTSLGVIYLVKGEMERALESTRKGYELDPHYDVCAANLAVVYHYLGDHPNRDKYAKEAEKLGYQNMEKLQALFRGELTIRE